MTLRIFIQFRSDRVPGNQAQKLNAVARAAIAIAFDRAFDHNRDFLHAQGEVYKEGARCHLLLDCDYLDFTPDLVTVPLQCYRVVKSDSESGL